MNARPLHRSSRLLAALALIALVLVGRLAESFHAVEAAHVVCPEHGELLHIEDALGHADASDEDVPSGPSVEQHHTSAEHHHCLMAMLLCSSGATWMPVETTTACVSLAFECASIRVERVRFSLLPLSFAPKHSPPARVV